MMNEASWVKPPTVKAKYLTQICTLLTNEGVWDREKKQFMQQTYKSIIRGPTE